MNPCTNAGNGEMNQIPNQDPINKPREGSMYPEVNGPPQAINLPSRFHPDDLKHIAKMVARDIKNETMGYSEPKSDINQAESEEDQKIRSFVGGLISEVFTHFSGKPDLQEKITKEFRRQMVGYWYEWREAESKEFQNIEKEKLNRIEQLSKAINFNEFSKQ